MRADYQAQLKAQIKPTTKAAPQKHTLVSLTPVEAVRTPVKRKTVKHEEDNLQAAVVKWFRYQYPEFAGNLWSCPNGGARNKITASIMKRTGQLAGVADLQLAIVRPNAPALFLELKVGKNKVSDAQRHFLANMKAQGYAVVVAYDFNAARAAIVNHIGY